MIYVQNEGPFHNIIVLGPRGAPVGPCLLSLPRLVASPCRHPRRLRIVDLQHRLGIVLRRKIGPFKSRCALHPCVQILTSSSSGVHPISVILQTHARSSMVNIRTPPTRPKSSTARAQRRHHICQRRSRPSQCVEPISTSISLLLSLDFISSISLASLNSLP